MRHSPTEDVVVLHVDDEPGFAELVADYLEREDPALSVRTATDAADALATLREDPPDCVVSDHDMPGTSGLELLERVREEYPDLPFVLFTGKGSEAVASRAISAGVTDYLQKEGGTDQYAILANRIRNAVERVRARTAVERSERRYHTLVDTAPIPILLFCGDGKLVYANEAAVSFLGADAEAALEGSHFTEFLHPEDRAASEQRFERLMAEGVPMPEREYRVLTVDGDLRRATVATAPGHYRGRRVAQAMIHE